VMKVCLIKNVQIKKPLYTEAFLFVHF